MSTADYITVAEAAELLAIGPAGVRYLIRAGRLKARRIGPEGPRCYYQIRRADLDKIGHLPRGRPRKVKAPQ